jgi:hypothetical protein
MFDNITITHALHQIKADVARALGRQKRGQGAPAQTGGK